MRNIWKLRSEKLFCSWNFHYYRVCNDWQRATWMISEEIVLRQIFKINLPLLLISITNISVLNRFQYWTLKLTKNAQLFQPASLTCNLIIWWTCKIVEIWTWESNKCEKTKLLLFFLAPYASLSFKGNKEKKTYL